MITTATLHTWTYLHDGCSPWAAFSGASEGGGTPPDWTQDDDPEHAIPPPDAAGVLWRQGDTSEVPPTIATVAAEFSEIIVSGQEVTPVAAYFSCGGRGVFLVRCCDAHYVLVARGEESPRMGASEHTMCVRVGMGLGDVCLFGA